LRCQRRLKTSEATRKEFSVHRYSTCKSTLMKLVEKITRFQRFRILLNASRLAYGNPVLGSLYRAVKPVIAQTYSIQIKQYSTYHGEFIQTKCICYAPSVEGGGRRRYHVVVTAAVKWRGRTLRRRKYSFVGSPTRYCTFEISRKDSGRFYRCHSLSFSDLLILQPLRIRQLK